MLTLDTLEQLATKLSNAVPGGADTIKTDLKNNFNAILQSTFSKLSLVSRDEFDRQTRTLAKARERLMELEARVRELETKNPL